MIKPPITKHELSATLDVRDENQIQKYVTLIDEHLRQNWQGQAMCIPVDAQFLPEHVVNRLTLIFNDAGWTISFVKGGSDQREGTWNGHFRLS